MAGGLFGLITGGALAYAGGKYKAAQEKKQEFQNIQLKGYLDDAEQTPEVVNNPEWQKGLKKVVGDQDAYDGLLVHFKAHAGAVARQKQAAQQFMGSILGIPGGASPQGQVQGGPPAPAAGTAPGQPAAPSSAPQSGGDTDYEGQLQKLQAAKAALGTMGFSPEQGKSFGSAIEDRIKDLQQQRQDAMHQQDFQQVQQRLDQAHADAQQNSADTRGLRAQQLALQKQQDAFNNWVKTQTLEEKKGKDKEAAQQKLETGFNSHVNQLSMHKLSLMSSLQTKLAAGTLTAKTAKPIIDAYNRNVDGMDRAAKKMGVDFDPEEYRLSVDPGKPGYFGVGGAGPSIEEDSADTAPITATNEKGEKIQWDGKTWAPVK